MLFNSALYGVFLIAVYAVFWSLRTHRLARASFLLVASYAFYFYGTFETARDQETPLGPIAWSALCLGVIFVGSTLDFWIGRALGKIDDPRARKALLLISILYYLGVLSIFKYFDFAVDSIVALAAAGGVHLQPTHLRLVLPFGISFFTFETMSYTIDVYRRELPPAERYLDYLLFVAFFPHLVAGPIVRPRDMLPQFARRPVPSWDDQGEGLWRIAVGLAKKIAIGDYLAIAIVGRVFENPERYSSVEVAVAVYAYAIQIYADFSGYTDIALGSAQLFGYRLPENFDAPYVARDLQDFWHRWHMSLSSWLRDYLYIPLGGSRKRTWKTYRNLMITMLLGGLWHGASWNFVIWGGLHGVGLAGTRMWQRRRGAPESAENRGASAVVARVVATLLTFHFVCFAWIFFRAKTFAHAELVLARLASGTLGTANVAPRVLLVVAAGMIVHVIPRRWEIGVRDRFVRVPAPVQGVVLAVAAWLIHRAAGAEAVPFVYGQF